MWLAGIGLGLGELVMTFGLCLSPFVAMNRVILLGAVLLFQRATLPVELDATDQAKRLIVDAITITQ